MPLAHPRSVFVRLLTDHHPTVDLLSRLKLKDHGTTISVVVIYVFG